jgi:hypothetical protein
MRQLPCAGNTENDELNHSPTDNAGVCVLGLVAEFGFALLHIVSNVHRSSNIPHPQVRVTYPLENLFSPDILQPRVQILDLLHQRLHLVLVRALNLACLANRHI